MWLRTPVQLIGTILARFEPCGCALIRHPKKHSGSTSMSSRYSIVCHSSLWLLRMLREFVIFDKSSRPILTLMDSCSDHL